MKSIKTSKPSSTDLQNKLIAFGRQFYEKGWMNGTAGNLSVKLNQSPLEIAISPSGVDKGSMTTKDLIHLKVGTDGHFKPQVKKGEVIPVPSAESSIHRAIHEVLPGCGAVFHVHPVHATLMSAHYGNPKQRQMMQIEWFEMMKGVGIGEGEIGNVPIFPNWQDIPRVADEVRNYLAQTPKALPGILIYNHGLTTWGRTPEQARNHLEILVFVFEYLYLKHQVKR